MRVNKNQIFHSRCLLNCFRFLNKAWRLRGFAVYLVHTWYICKPISASKKET